MTEEIERQIDEMAARWPSNLVARKAVKEFTGGIVSQKTLANLDCAGDGPEGRFLLMNQTVYPKESLIAWLKTKAAKSWKTRRAA